MDKRETEGSKPRRNISRLRLNLPKLSERVCQKNAPTRLVARVIHRCRRRHVLHPLLPMTRLVRPALPMTRLMHPALPMAHLVRPLLPMTRLVHPARPTVHLLHPALPMARLVRPRLLMARLTLPAHFVAHAPLPMARLASCTFYGMSHFLLWQALHIPHILLHTPHSLWHVLRLALSMACPACPGLPTRLLARSAVPVA